MTEVKKVVKVVFELPNDSTPGYLRRMKNLAEFQKAQKGAVEELDRFEALCGFLAGYVREPADPEEAKDALMDATKEQIDELFALIGGRKAQVPPSSGESLETTTQ